VRVIEFDRREGEEVATGLSDRKGGEGGGGRRGCWELSGLQPAPS
jgi:hypothetical protein